MGRVEKCDCRRSVKGLLSLFLSLVFASQASSCVIQPRVTPLPAESQVKITSPSGNNAPAGDVKVTVNIKNFDVKSSGNPRSFREGRIIYYLDVTPPTNYEIEAFTLGGTYALTTEISYTWKNVTPGNHTFWVQLVNSDNLPLPIPAVDKIAVNLNPSEGAPQIKIKTPKDGDTVAPGAVTVSVDVSNFIVSGEGTGPINNQGAGHIVYYIDTDPPTKQGEPAVTEIYRSTAELSQRWKSVTEGNHTFSAQLVNNDDTPLDPPVTDTVKVNVSAS